METIELPLLPNTSNTLSISSPLSQTDTNNEIQNLASFNPQFSLENTINAIFPIQIEENKIQRARNILGKKAAQTTDEELAISLTQFEFLVNCWLDEFERESFSGKTLEEMLKLE